MQFPDEQVEPLTTARQDDHHCAMQDSVSGLSETLRQVSVHARRAVARQAIAAVAANGGTVPSPQELTVTFDTRHEGVELSHPRAGDESGCATIILRGELPSLTVDETAFAVVLPVDGGPQSFRVPFLALRSFSDPSAGYGLAFDAVPTGEREYAQSVLETAMELLGPVMAGAPIDHAGTERNVDRAVLCVALSRLEDGTGLPDDEHYLVTVDPGHAGVRLPAAIVGQGVRPVTLTIGKASFVRTALRSFEAEVPVGNGLTRCIVPYPAVTEFSAPTAGLSWRFAPAAIPASPPQKRRPLMDRFIASSGHLIHKLKAKDSTGRWAYYFVYIPEEKERDFFTAIKGDGMIDLEDYGKVVASCYGEQPTHEVAAYLKERYGLTL